MKTLSRDDILGAEDLRTETVEVPEWKGSVVVRELTGAQRDQYESSIVTIHGKEAKVNSVNLRAKLVAMSCVGDDGKRLFTMKDAVNLGEKSASALDRIVDVAKRLSRIGEEELEELGEG